MGLVSKMADGLIADVAKLFGFEADFTLPVLLVVVLFGIGTDYILFVLFRYRERLRAGDEPGDAVAFAVGRVGEAVASSALVVVAAFCALLLSALESNQTLGPSLAISVLVMLAAGGADTSRPGRARTACVLALEGLDARARGRAQPAFAAALVRRPVAFALAPLAVLAALAVGMASLTPDYDQFTAMKSNKEASRAFNDLKASFPQGAIDPTEVVVTGDEPLAKRELGELAKRLGAVKGVEAVTPPTLSKDGETARLRVLPSTRPRMRRSTSLRDLCATRHTRQAGDRVFVGGTSSANAGLRAGNEEDRSTVYPAAAALIALILALLLRSLVAPLFLLISVGLGFAATLKASVFVFQDIAGDPGLSFQVPILVYLFVVAIGTDYNILVTARVREEVADGAEPRQAVEPLVLRPDRRRGRGHPGGHLRLADDLGRPSFVQIGLAVCGGIISAFLLGIMLVPALTSMAGERMWWPGRPGGARRPTRRARAGVAPTTQGASESA